MKTRSGRVHLVVQDSQDSDRILCNLEPHTLGPLIAVPALDESDRYCVRCFGLAYRLAHPVTTQP
jgi:hypothetical protein